MNTIWEEKNYIEQETNCLTNSDNVPSGSTSATGSDSTMNEWNVTGNLKPYYNGETGEYAGENASHVIYLWTEKRNGVEYPCYVGQTINKASDRIRKHLLHDEPFLFQRKLRKRPTEFKCYLICECKSIDELNAKETESIIKYNTFKDTNEFGYNLTLGGNNALPSAETKNKMSISHMGRVAPNKGIPCSKEAKEKLSKRFSGKNHPFYGKSHSDETKLKISKKNSKEGHPMWGKTRDVNFRNKISIANSKRHISNEMRKNMSNAVSLATSKTGIKGVSLYGDKFIAYAYIPTEKRKYLGIFDTKDEARLIIDEYIKNYEFERTKI